MFVKVTLNDHKRKFKLSEDASIEKLMVELVRCFGEQVKGLNLGYVDSDKEFISITSNEEWEICVEEAVERCSGKGSVTVELEFKGEKCDFVVVAMDTTQETIECPEIQEEPKAEPTLESVPQEKVIEEVHKEQVIEEKPAVPEEPKEESKEESKHHQHIIDVATEFGLGELAKNILENISQCGMTVEHCATEVEPVEEMNESRTSTMSEEVKNEIEDLIEEKIRKAMNKCKGSFKKKEKPAHSNFTHAGIFCDGCQKTISNCARFKSLVVPDYDLCEACEATGIHQGPMVKFNTPSEFNAGLLNHKFNEIIPMFTKQEERRHHGHHWGKGRCGFGNRVHGMKKWVHENLMNKEAKPELHLDQILKNIPQEISGFLSHFIKKPECQQPKHDQQTLEIVKSIQTVLPEFPEEDIVRIVKENKFQTAEETRHLILS